MLELDLRMLILRYGKQRVLDGLSQLGEQVPEDVEQKLRAAKRGRRPPVARSSAVELAVSECRDHPEIAEAVRSLAVGFQNRTFLPNLRDVERFLDRVSAAHGKLKSRVAAAPVLIRTLVALRREELLRLVAENSSTSESDYSLLARAIMKPEERVRNSHEHREKAPGT